MKIVVTSQWILRLPLAYFLITHFKFGPSAVWWAMNSSILFHAVFVSIRYFRKRWLYNDL
jgi:Na+-driven multidrug efflux pump